MTDPDELSLAYLAGRPADAARVLDRLDPAVVGAFLADVPVRLAAAPLAAMVPWRAGRCLSAMAPSHAAALVEALPAGRAPGCLRAMPGGARAAVLDAMPPRRARALRQQLRYPAGLVGAHMDAAPLALRMEATVEEAREALRASDRSDVLQLHVLDEAGCPSGVVGLVDLLTAPGDRVLSALMTRDCRPLGADLPLSRVDRGHDWTERPERPVVDGHGRLVGSVTLARLVAVSGEQAPPITAGAGPLIALVRACAATAGGLARVLAGLATSRGEDRRGR